MGFFDLYLAGLPLILHIHVIFFLFVGGAIGVIFGVLPGLGPTMGVTIILTLTYTMSPQIAFALLFSVYCGATYGGSISAILANIPGTPAAIMTVLEGYPMSKRGEAGRAISLATICSCVGGMVSVFLLALFAPLIAKMALKFSAQEFTAIIVFALSIIVYLSPVSMLKGFLAALFGLLVGTIGADPMTAHPRFTFRSTNLLGGIELIPVLIGVFGISEVLEVLSHGAKETKTVKVMQKISGSMRPKLSEIKKLIPTILRGSFIGTFLGAVPAAGGSTAAIVSYGIEKWVSKEPELFGTGIPEGIAGPESANNGATGGAMIPMMTLGIPGDATTAVLLGALTIHGLLPGPTLFTEHREIVSAIFILLALSNFVFLVYGLLGARFFAMILNFPTIFLMPAVVVFCVLGSYALRNSMFDVGILLASGALGYVMRRTGMHPAPFLLAFILGPILEANLRRSLALSGGDFTTFFTRPISLILLISTVCLVITPYLKKALKGLPK